jgi:hypothetical protein
MRAALHAEWTKVRTSPDRIWLLPVLIAVTIGLGVTVDTTTNCLARDSLAQTAWPETVART